LLKRLRGSPNLFGEAVEAVPRELVVDGPAFMGFVESVEDSKQDCSQSDDGDFDDSLWQRERFEVAEDLFATAELPKFSTLEVQFDAVEVTVPFVVERAVVAAAMCHPKASAVESDAVRGHAEILVVMHAACVRRWFVKQTHAGCVRHNR